MRISPQDVRVHPGRRAVAGLLGVVLSALTTYLRLDRSHAEELGGGSRAVLDLVRGDRQLPLALVLALLVVTVAATVSGRRPLVGAGARRG